MAEGLMNLMGGLMQGFAQGQQASQQKALLDAQIKTLQAKSKAQEQEQSLQSMMFQMAFPQMIGGAQGQGGSMSPMQRAVAGEVSGLDLLGAGRLEQQERRGSQLREEALLRISEMKRRNDLQEQAYLRGFTEWVAEDVKMPDGSTKTYYLPKYGDIPPMETEPSPGVRKPKQLPTAIREKVSTTQLLIDELRIIRENAQESYVGLSGLQERGELSLSGIFPSLSDPDYASWSMLFNGLKAIERHEKFGAAFTQTEKQAFKRMFPSEARSFADFLSQMDTIIDHYENKKTLMIETQTLPRDMFRKALAPGKPTEDMSGKTDEELLQILGD